MTAARLLGHPPSLEEVLASLPVPPEPLALKARTRRQVLEEPACWPELAGHGGWIADWLWRRWSPALSGHVARKLVREVASGYERELWLWLMGERTWSHVVDGLEGRLRRRAPRRVS